MLKYILEKYGIAESVPAGAFFFSEKYGIPKSVPAGAFFSQKSTVLLRACPQGLFFSQKSTFEKSSPGTCRSRRDLHCGTFFFFK